jgi:DNA repair exonuclease SbcCD nuclease subunit
LVGNHDKSLTGDEHAMLAHHDQIVVVDQPVVLDWTLFMPHMDNSRFVEECNSRANINAVVCHQTFDGAKYTDAFFAPDGVDASAIPQSEVISGHIHTAQQFGKVRYLGSPRWTTLNDANVEKAVYFNSEPIDTSGVCSPISLIVESPNSYVLEIPKGRVTVELRGDRKWIEERKRFWDGKAKVRCLPVREEKAVEIRESDGISTAMQKFLDNYQPWYFTTPEVKQIVSERLRNV